MGKPLTDIAAPGLSVIFCGVNPGLSAAAAGHHFVDRSNRFWRVLHLAGFTPRLVAPEDEAILLSFGLGVASIVERPSAAVTDLARSEFTAAAARFEDWVRRQRPGCVAFLGKTAYGAMRGRRTVSWGRQDDLFAGAVAWILPDPSGRNRAYGLEALVAAYSALRLSAEAGFGLARDGRGLAAVHPSEGASPCA